MKKLASELWVGDNIKLADWETSYRKIVSVGQEQWGVLTAIVVTLEDGCKPCFSLNSTVEVEETQNA